MGERHKDALRIKIIGVVRRKSYLNNRLNGKCQYIMMVLM